MKVTVNKSECKHLKDQSSYGHNYYVLPCYVEGCNILLATYSGAEEFEGYSIGLFLYNTYKEILFLNVEERKGEFIFDSEKISKDNKIT